MAPRESIFASLAPSLAGMADAVEKIEALIAAKRMKKKLFYDMLLGFRFLEQSLQQKQSEAYKWVMIWMNLFLRIQSVVSSSKEIIRNEFEKLVPSAVTYMIGCLQHKAKGIISYHFQLLEMIYELLSKVRPEVLEKLATFETGIIACIWFPIYFVGDFNTQMLALRLLVMLLKCLDSTRLQSELDNIRCADISVMKDKLKAAIAVANFHAAKFENIARDLLNTYNMHLAENILVYSFRCITFKFGGCIEFLKPLNADQFWIDFNCCPSTLSFSGRCKKNNQAEYANCSVILQIVMLSLNRHILSVKFKAPVRFNDPSSVLPNLAGITTAQILLTGEEATRLFENKFILKYYNKFLQPKELSVIKLHTTSTPIRFQSIESVEKTALYTDAIAFDNLQTNNNFENIINMENKENVPPEVRNITDMHTQWPITQGSKSNASHMEAVSKQFQKSFNFLIGLSNKDNEKVNQKPLTENTTMGTKTTAPSEGKSFKLPQIRNREKQPSDKKPENNHPKPGTSKIVDYDSSTSKSSPSSNKSKSSPKDIVKNPQRRFFKTLTSNSESDCNTRKTKKMPHKRNNRNKKQTLPVVSSKKSKQINEVKPMLHSSKELSSSATNTSINRTMTEINTVFNVNVCNTNAIDPSSPKLTTDQYENCLVSDAEPGQSYRNFEIRQNRNDDEKKTSTETKRFRKSLPRAAKKEVPKAFLLGRNSQILRKGNPGRKRVLCMDPFDELKGETDVPKKMGKSEKTTDRKNIADAVLRSCTSYKQKKNSHIQSFPIQEPNSSLNLDEVSKTSTHSFQDNIDINEVEVTQMPNNLSVSADVAEVSGYQVDEIQECRRNTGHDSDEFSDYPTFLHMMDISDILPSSECESTKDINIRTANEPKTMQNEAKCSDIHNQTCDSNLLFKPYSNVIYYSRSENESDGASDGGESEQSISSPNNILEPIAQPLKLTKQVFVTPQLPMKNFQKTTSVTKCHVTTTATSIITQQDHVIQHQEFIVNLPSSTNSPLNLSKSCSRATTTSTAKTVVKERKEINMNSSMQRSMNVTTQTPKALKQESSNLITTHKDNLNLQLKRMESDVPKNSTNIYLSKICDLGERIINEIERERKSLLELEVNAERFARQLRWQYEAYQRKTQQFECFKQNLETLLCVLSNVNLLEVIENEAQNKIQQLHQISNSMASQQWRNFINEATENLLKDISSLTDL